MHETGGNMKRLKFIFTALFVIFSANLCVNAATIGYADFDKVLNDYSFARNAYKEIDNKSAELRQYALDKDKQFKAIESPIQKKTFEDQVQKEFAAKAEKINTLTAQKEKTIRDNVLAACKSVAVSKKLDAIVDSSVIYAGGVDVTNDIIQILNTPKK